MVLAVRVSVPAGGISFNLKNQIKKNKQFLSRIFVSSSKRGFDVRSQCGSWWEGESKNMEMSSEYFKLFKKFSYKAKYISNRL